MNAQYSPNYEICTNGNVEWNLYCQSVVYMESNTAIQLVSFHDKQYEN